MRKFLAATAIALALASTSALADNVTGVDSFQGGFDVVTLNGNFCAMTPSENAANYFFAAVMGAKFNGNGITLYNANEAGWGFGSYGGNTCVIITLW